MRIQCAACGCIVDGGIRVAVCGDPRSCCSALPVVEDLPRSSTADASEEQDRSAHHT